MPWKVLHVYRNTPLGRETLRQAADFAKKTGSDLNVYIPEFDRFLLYFQRNAVEIRLDQSYSYLPETARENVEKVLMEMGVALRLVKITSKTASNLPNLPTDFDFFSLPKVMVERQGRIQLGAIGTGVRQLVKNALTPALIAPGPFRDWSEILIFFGGSSYSVTALKWGMTLADTVGVPLNVVTLAENKKDKAAYEEIVQQHQIDVKQINQWEFVPSGSPVILLNKISCDALIVMGAYGHGRVYSKLFGSKTEFIQKNVAQLLMLIGENCKPPK
ncbi:MAG: universal stress protein [bacterium]